MAIDKYTLKDGTTKYRATTYVQGQRVQKRGFRTKRDAQKWIDKTRVEGRLQTNLTYGQMCELFLAAYLPTTTWCAIWANRVISGSTPMWLISRLVTPKIGLIN